MIDEQKKALEIMRNVKEFLDPFLTGKDDYMPILPQIYEALKGRPDLPISLYDGKYNYSSEGITEATRERLIYAPINVHVGVGEYWFFYYKNGNYDIDNDIAHISEIEMTESDKCYYNIEFYDGDEYQYYTEFYGTYDEASDYASEMEPDFSYSIYEA